MCSDTCASTQAHIRPSVHAYTRAHTCTRTGEKFAAPRAHPKMHTALCRASGGRFGALKVSASGSYPPPAICAPRTARWPSLHLANRVRASSIFWSGSGPSYGSGPGALSRESRDQTLLSTATCTATAGAIFGRYCRYSVYRSSGREGMTDRACRSGDACLPCAVHKRGLVTVATVSLLAFFYASSPRRDTWRSL